MIGVSGGLDSTHALIVAARAMDQLGLPRTNILGYTMPGFATGEVTKSNAWKLMDALRITAKELDIRPTARQMLEGLEHRAAAYARTLTEERFPMRRSDDRNVRVGGSVPPRYSGALPDDGGDASSCAWTARWTLPWILSVPIRSRMPSLPRMERTLGLDPGQSQRDA